MAAGLDRRRRRVLAGGAGAGLLVVGAALLLATWWGRAAALVPIGLLLAFLLVADEMLDVPLDAGIGDRDIVVDSRRGATWTTSCSSAA